MIKKASIIVFSCSLLLSASQMAYGMKDEESSSVDPKLTVTSPSIKKKDEERSKLHFPSSSIKKEEVSYFDLLPTTLLIQITNELSVDDLLALKVTCKDMFSFMESDIMVKPRKKEIIKWIEDHFEKESIHKYHGDENSDHNKIKELQLCLSPEQFNLVKWALLMESSPWKNINSSKIKKINLKEASEETISLFSKFSETFQYDLIYGLHQGAERSESMTEIPDLLILGDNGSQVAQRAVTSLLPKEGSSSEFYEYHQEYIEKNVDLIKDHIFQWAEKGSETSIQLLCEKAMAQEWNLGKENIVYWAKNGSPSAVNLILDTFWREQWPLKKEEIIQLAATYSEDAWGTIMEYALENKYGFGEKDLVEWEKKDWWEKSIASRFKESLTWEDKSEEVQKSLSLKWAEEGDQHSKELLWHMAREGKWGLNEQDLLKWVESDWEALGFAFCSQDYINEERFQDIIVQIAKRGYGNLRKRLEWKYSPLEFLLRDIIFSEHKKPWRNW